MAEIAFARPVATNPKPHCDQLRKAIVQAIDWKSISETTSPALYHRMKQEILSLRDSGLVLIRLAELNQRMEMPLCGKNLELAELESVGALLAGPGMIQRLDFGGFILLRPVVLMPSTVASRELCAHRGFARKYHRASLARWRCG